MPVHREKEADRISRRETSVKRQTGERPIITQIKPSKTEAARTREGTYLKNVPKIKKTVEKPVKRSETQRSRTRTRTLSPSEVKQLNKIKPEEPNPPREPEQDYEDDFEEYESDFESEEEEKEEEKKEEEEEQLPRPEPVPVKRNQKEIDEIKLAMKLENEMTKRKNIPEMQTEVVKEILDVSSKKKKSETTNTRGRDLLGMITLDTISYSFLHIPSVPYEEYMKMYGRSNMKQVHVQTNEDNLNEETQTEVIEVLNKWVQKPPEVGEPKKYRLTKEERLGVGGDDLLDQGPGITAIDTNRLNDFLQRASEILLPILEAETGNSLRMDKLENQSEEMYFSDGFVSLNVQDLPFLENKSVTGFFCAKNQVNSLFSVHGSYSFGESVICLWNINDLSKPMKVLKAQNKVTALCSGLRGLTFAGLADGTVCLWDLKESSVVHENTTRSGWVLRSPTYSTAQLEQGHLSKVVSIHVLRESDERELDFAPLQVCSLEEKGIIIIWSVVQGRKLNSDDDIGLAHWGKVKLVKTSTFSCLGREVPDYVTCNDLALDQSKEIELFVANSSGSVMHLSKYGTLMKPKMYGTSELGDATCLEMCPFDSNYFLAGCKDGSIKLCSRNQQLPLISLNGNVADEGPQAEIVSLSWLFVRPFVIFALDSLSRIHIWDLGLSDMYPEVTLTLTGKKISCAVLMQCDSERERPHFVLGTRDGKIEIHRLKPEYGTRTRADIQKDVKKFIKYVSIL